MQMKFSDGQSGFSRVFNFAILGYSQKLDAYKKLVFYSIKRGRAMAVLSVAMFALVG